MASPDNASVARAFNESFNGRDWDATIALTTPDVRIVNVPSGQTFEGAEGVRQWMQGWATAFPDGKVETTNVIADEHGAAVEFVGRGTHTGPFQTPAGTIPPTGRPAELSFVYVLMLQQGKVSRASLYFDVATLLRQLGIMPSDAAD